MPALTAWGGWFQRSARAAFTWLSSFGELAAPGLPDISSAPRKQRRVISRKLLDDIVDFAQRNGFAQHFHDDARVIRRQGASTVSRIATLPRPVNDPARTDLSVQSLALAPPN